MSDFERAMTFVLRHEGGYVHDPDDPGGETNQGITRRVYDTYRLAQGLVTRSVRLINPEEVREIYRVRYWLPSHCEGMTWPLSASVFDAAVNTGVRQGRKLLQRALGVADDGQWGPQTAAAVQSASPKETALRMCRERIEFYHRLAEERPALSKFLRGWIHRVNALSGLIEERPEETPVTVLVDGRELTEVGALTEQGVTVLLRPVAEALGAQVHWDGRTKTVRVASATD